MGKTRLGICINSEEFDASIERKLEWVINWFFLLLCTDGMRDELCKSAKKKIDSFEIFLWNSWWKLFPWTTKCPVLEKPECHWNVEYETKTIILWTYHEVWCISRKDDNGGQDTVKFPLNDFFKKYFSLIILDQSVLKVLQPTLLPLYLPLQPPSRSPHWKTSILPPLSEVKYVNVSFFNPSLSRAARIFPVV